MWMNKKFVYQVGNNKKVIWILSFGCCYPIVSVWMFLLGCHYLNSLILLPSFEGKLK